MAAMKYTRDDFRDRAKGIARQLEPRRSQRTPHRRRMPVFLILYAGVGLYVILGVFLSSRTPSSPTPSKAIVAPAIVLERLTESGPRDETRYSIRLEVSPAGADSFEHLVLVDQASWETMKEGDALLMRYERIRQGQAILLLGLSSPQASEADDFHLEVEEPEGTLFEEIRL